MDLKRLRYFQRVAEDGSLSRAAGVLRIAQPALSRQMRVLEKELGVALFRRSARGMRLTEAGDYLLAAIAGPLRDIDLAVRTLRSGSTGIAGDFVVGMPPGVCDVVGRPLAVAMRTDHPDVRLRIVEGVCGSLVEWLVRGIVDVALLDDAPDDPRLAARCVLDEPLMLVGPAGVAATAVALRQAMAFPLILPAHHLGTRRVLGLAAAKQRLTVAAVAETDAPGLAVALVGDGLGHAILPALLARPSAADATVVLRRIDDPGLRYRLHLATRDQARLAQGRGEAIVADAIVAAVKQAASGAAGSERQPRSDRCPSK